MTCGECKGQGQVVRIQQTILGAMQSAVQCHMCRGAGKIPEKSCKQCGGEGVERGKSEFKVKIPEGIHDGAAIRLTGQGEHPGVGGVAGDLYVKVHLKKDKRFVREGDDIHTEITIDYPQAVLGETVDIQTLEGEKQLVVPPGTQPLQKIRLKGYGTPRLRGSGRGDQYVKVIVEVPKKVNKKAKKLLEELKSEL